MGSRGCVIAGLAAATFLFAACGANANVLITVDKSLQQMTVSVDGVRRYTWPVSTGRAGYATPSGSYTPFRMEVDHFSKEWDDAPMPNSIFFTPKGHAIHGSFDTRHLGSAASHGCVRLAPKNAAALFALVKAEGMGNTKVVLSGQAPPMVARRSAPTGEAAAPMELQRQQSPYAAQRPQYAGQPQYAAQQPYQPYPTQPRFAPFPFGMQQQPYGARDPRFDPRY